MRSRAFERFKKRNTETQCVLCEVMQLSFALNASVPKGSAFKAICVVHEAREDSSYEEEAFASSKPVSMEGSSLFCAPHGAFSLFPLFPLFSLSIACKKH